VSVENKFLLRKSTGDQPIVSDADLREWFQKGQCKPADFVFDFSAKSWVRVGDHPAMANLFSDKPAHAPDRRVVYFLPPGGTVTMPQGPFSTKEILQRAQLREICSSTWVFVEGDKEWRQVKSVKILNDMLPELPTEKPPAPADGAADNSGPAAEVPLPAEPVHEAPSMPSIKLDLGTPSGVISPLDEPFVEREESTMAMDTMGLNLHSEHATPPPAPSKPSKPGLAPIPGTVPAAPPPAAASAPIPAAPPRPPVPAAAPAMPPAASDPDKTPPRLTLQSDPAIPKPPPKGGDSFDGIEAEIPMDPIWLVKQATSETALGPYRFLEVIKFLEEGRLTRNDKIARTGTKAFVKIAQQYEFSVKYSLETVVEGGQEKQKILIRRRHPRGPYITGVQITGKQGQLVGQCVNISAGGILMEAPKAEFNLGEIIEVKILPGLIAKAISCRSLIIGKIPKIPPGYALKFEDLKQEDKEAIEYYVQETLKREMSKKN
jgi:hypothetical protein